ncbi:MAG: T9SS type A sorting domain-containing protein [Flavobacteriaceae bacterium]|nr:T9SS type A sorting domain-containing protein [Flavobacteriaceae bacterium]
MKFLLSLLVICFVFEPSKSQSVHAVSMSPAPQSMTATNDQPIVITFDQSLDPASVTASSFLVFGRWSGPMSGQFSFASSNTVVKFIPDRNYIYGEWITVRLTSGIVGIGGDPLVNGFGANYWIKSLPASLDLEFAGQIDMRLPGEGALTCYGAYAGDVNNDELSDLVVVTEDSDDIRVMLNDGAQGYEPFIIIEMPAGQGPSTNDGADFNHDGLIDMAIGSTYSDNVAVLMGDPTTLFGNQQNYQTGEGVRGIAVADFNGDGWDDIAAANRADSSVSILLNDGSGLFEPAVNFNTGYAGETSVAATDLNNDGYIDLLVASYDNGRVISMLNDGTANFTVNAAALVGNGPWMLAIGDVNGDGFVDVATANRFTDNVSIVLSDGTGDLELDAHYPVNKFPVAIDLGDIDGDGDLDFISSNVIGGDYTLMENDGTGTFVNPRVYPSADMSACAIIHDRNNDGALDLTMIDEAADVVILYNNGPPLSIDEVENELGLTLYPNPFHDTVFVGGSVSGLLNLQLYDMHGRLLISQEMGLSKQFDFSFPELKEGTYFAVLNHNGVSKVVKILKTSLH